MNKNKILIIALFLFIGIGCFVTQRVLSQSDSPVVVVCQNAAGLLFVKDGNECPRKSVEVSLNIEDENNGGSSSEGYVLFIGYPYVLTKDGNVWNKEVVDEDSGEEEWFHREVAVVDGSLVGHVVQWDGAGLRFLLDDGRVYSYDRNSKLWSDQGGIVDPN
ncbi:MAG: hypothetical protein PHY93_21240 [Bacteriovorax sp.]|nr:hypothetical protein [Bacteriovorax sp.]